MTETTFPHAQQAWSMFEKAAKNNAAMFEAAVDTSVAVTKASLSYAAQLSEQWSKLATESARRFTKPTA
jgi:hypothetical protein